MTIGIKSLISKHFKSPWEEDDDKKPQKKPEEDFDEIFRKGKIGLEKLFERYKKDNNHQFNFNSSASKYLGLFLVAVFSLWFITGFYVVNEGEQALVLRFGKYVRTATTGLNYHLPQPIEIVKIENVEAVRKVEIGYRSANSKNTNPIISSGRLKEQKTQNDILHKESLMLTGDENILDINFVVQWKISSLKDYAFNVAHPEETVKNAAESAMREVVGSTPLSVAQTEGRSKMQHEAKTLLQKILDSYSSGIEITVLQMLKVDPPLAVIDSFRDVQTAKADKEKAINQAYAYKNDIIPRARGEAAQIIQHGEAYKREVVLRAQGEVSKFNAVYNQYKSSKELTRNRIYIETMEHIFKDLDKVLLDNSRGQGVVPYLALPNINKQN
jgi:membrane protease subunit HflK